LTTIVLVVYFYHESLTGRIPMSKKYNTVKGDNIVDVTKEREFLDALSACVVLTPDEEERICPSRIPVPGVDDVDCDEPVLDEADDFGPDVDDLNGPENDELSDEELVRLALYS
jgi:hypothetical protein